ncbi:MAG: caspase family protein [Bacteroidota bacterium]
MRYNLLVFFNLLSYLVTAQTIITWIAPLATEMEIVEDQLTLQAVITSTQKLTTASVSVFINDKKYNAKADVIKLGQANKAATKFDFSATIELGEGENQVKIGVILPDSTIVYSLTKILQKTDNRVVEVVRNHTDGAKGIYWIYPGWQSSPLVLDQRQLTIKAIINSPVALQKKDCYLVRQQIVKIPLAETAKFKEIQPSKYELTTTVQLEETGLIDLIIKVKSPLLGTLSSEPLPINFEPYLPNVHLLSVGTETDLAYTINDAEDFATLFQSQNKTAGGILFSTVDIQTLTGAAATATEIKSAVERLETKFKNGQIGTNDLILLYLSSHGFLDERRQLRIQGADYDPGAWRTTSVAYERDIIEILQGLPCKKLIFIDACHSGGGEKSNSATIKYELQNLNHLLTGVTTIVSSSGAEISYEDEAWQNGAFTEAIIEGLSHYRADIDRNYIITINELWQYIRQRVPNLVKTVKAKTQHPQLLANELGDLAIFSVK